MKTLQRGEVHARSVERLGLDPEIVDLSTPEALASAVRRAASFQCPCAPRTLRQSVVQSLKGLVDGSEASEEAVDEMIQDLVGYGDLQEHRVETDNGRKSSQLYASPPSFILRETGNHLLLGIQSGGVPLLLEEVGERLHPERHVRRFHEPDQGEAARFLSDHGLRELQSEEWLGLPRPKSPSSFIAPYDRELETSPSIVDLPNLTVLDSEKPVRYYRGRWREVSGDEGRFVGRRPQAYGADIWCYVEVENGTPQRLVGLPLPTSKWRGCDGAWHLQAAIDAERGTPQVYRAQQGRRGQYVLEFFSPVPAWMQRRLDAVATPVSRDGCLLAYALPEEELEEELSFLENRLWMANRDAT